MICSKFISAEFDGFGRSCDVLWFKFKNNNGEIYIHAQCWVRIFIEENFYISSDFIYHTLDNSADWDVFGNTIYDKRMFDIIDKIVGKRVKKFSKTGVGDYSIDIDDCCTIQLIANRPNDENWRAIIEKTHYVLRNNEFEIEE